MGKINREGAVEYQQSGDAVHRQYGLGRDHCGASVIGVLSVVALLASVAAAQTAPPEVTHMWAQQRANTFLVDVTYSVSDPDNDELFISLILFTGSGTVISPCNSVTGDVGAGIGPGANKHITWDAGADFPGQYGSDYTLRVVANDGVAPSGFVLVPPGTFMMGSPTTEPGRRSDETQHQVTLTHGVYVQSTEVTNQQFTAMAQWAYDRGYATVDGTGLRDNLDGSTEILKPWGDRGRDWFTLIDGTFSCRDPDHPVMFVTWYGAAAYCDWLSLKLGLPRAYSHSTWLCGSGSPYEAVGYRLPTEAEWEYACRAGSTTAFAAGTITEMYCSPVDPQLDGIAWYCGNAEGFTHPVAQKLPNVWGLFDMHGNLFEWCNDRYTDAVGEDVTDPVGPETGTYRVNRGGDWNNWALFARAALRSYSWMWTAHYSYGFRTVRSCN